MSSRIDSENINLGESFVINFEDDAFYRGKSKVLHEENKRKAGSIIENAQYEANRIIEEAKQRAAQEAQDMLEALQEESRITGYNAGYETGYNEGKTTVYADLEEKVLMVNNFVQNNFEIKKRIIKSAHLDILKLVVEITDKICHKKLETNNEILQNIIEAAVNLLTDKESINIIMNPLMNKHVKEITEKLISENSLISSIKLIEDSSVSTDGVIVEGVQGRVDSRISSQIEEIAEKLLNQLQSISEDELVAEVSGEEENQIPILPEITNEEVNEIVDIVEANENEEQGISEISVEAEIVVEPSEPEITDNQGQNDDSV